MKIVPFTQTASYSKALGSRTNNCVYLSEGKEQTPKRRAGVREVNVITSRNPTANELMERSRASS
jgi:hypothetical protein